MLISRLPETTAAIVPLGAMRRPAAYEVVEQPYSWDRTWDPYSAGTELQAITGLIDADLGRCLPILQRSGMKFFT